MGEIIIVNTVDEILINDAHTSFVVCSKKVNYKSWNLEEIAVNKILACALLVRRNNQQSFLIDDVFHQTFKLGTQRIILKDFEILFDPEYKLDVLKFIENLSRRVKIIALWPGTYKDNILFFSKPDYEDYAAYKVSDYNITLLIEREKYEIL